jgi:uncharacterized membrane protein
LNDLNILKRDKPIMNASKFFTKKQKDTILKAIAEAEIKTSGEIKVHIENHCQTDVMNRAEAVFMELQLDKTEQRNGILIYIALTDRKVAILGDKGIDKATPENYWETELDALKKHFKEENYTGGIVSVINDIAEKLEEFFPYLSDDINELSDEISFYDN